MWEDRLPPVMLKSQTLVVTYLDGSDIQVPYFDRDAALLFLNGQKDIADVAVKQFTIDMRKM